jgi:amino acid exporter
MVESIISGIGLGIVLSFLTGPVFFALIKISIEKGVWAGMALSAGVFLSDILYIIITLYGSSYLKLESEYRLQIGIIGSVILMSIGIYYIFKKVTINYENTPKTRHYTAFFLKGFFMCVFNPAILLYWVSVTSGFISVAGKMEARDIVPFFGAILFMQVSMDFVKAYYANKLRNKIKVSTIAQLNRIAGVLIIIFALRLIYNLVFTQSLI